MRIRLPILVPFVAASLVSLAACPGPATGGSDGGETPDASIESDGGPTTGDAGMDAGTDAGISDAGESDAGIADAGQPDAGLADAGSLGTGSLSGPFEFPVVSARTVWNHELADGGRGQDYVQVLLTDNDFDFCDAMQMTPPPTTQALNLSVGLAEGGDTNVITSGTYVVDNGSAPSPSGGVEVFRATLSSTGYELLGREASGTITFDSVDFTGAAGSFDITFSLADGGMSPLSGTFDAPSCPF